MIDHEQRRRMFIDMLDGSPGPVRGDLVVSIGKKGPGTKYLVLRSRKVNRRDPAAPPRYTLDVKVVDVLTERMKLGHIFEITWYPRNKRTKTFEQHMRRDVE